MAIEGAFGDGLQQRLERSTVVQTVGQDGGINGIHT